MKSALTLWANLEAARDDDLGIFKLYIVETSLPGWRIAKLSTSTVQKY